MSKLEDLVPPLELCRQIPKGKFADSAMVWVNGDISLRTVCFEMQRDLGIVAKYVYPAPTLQEIIKEIKNFENYCIRFDFSSEYGWCMWDDNDAVELIDNPAAAALKLWLELEGGECQMTI